MIARQLGADNVDGVDWDVALAEARQHIECIVLDSLTAGNNVVAKVLGELQGKYWRIDGICGSLLLKMVQKMSGKRKGRVKSVKKTKHPKFCELQDALHKEFSTAMFQGTGFEAFDTAEVTNAALYGIVVAELDEAHTAGWKKLMAKAKKILDSVKPGMNTSTNEQIHSHKNHYAPKGIKMTNGRFDMLMNMTALSWNIVPGWTNRVVEDFLSYFRGNQ